VRLNGRPVGVPTRLADGDVIELGAVELIFEVR
jgi:pSer/pThr/pTyr-binding forkhead associated (FHA) protein